MISRFKKFSNKNLFASDPEQVQALVKTWFDILDLMINHPSKVDRIMAARARASLKEF